MPDRDTAASPPSVDLLVNGQPVSVDVPVRATLASVLRAQLGLTGTHLGCDTAACGACTVILDGEPVKSCTVLAVQCQGVDVRTVEGLSDAIRPLQEAFVRHRAVQCGFCTPGMLMAAVHLAEHTDGVPADAEIRRAIGGNLCRCTGYHSIVDAIADGAARMAEATGHDTTEAP